MFLRLLYESFRRQKRRKLLAGVAIMLGVGVATAMIAVATDIGDKISRELRTYGANLIVTPQEDTLDVEIGGVNLKPPSDGAYLNEADLPKIKGMFWRNNIVGFAPMLPVSVALGRRKERDSAGNVLFPACRIRTTGFHHRCSHHASLVESSRARGPKIIRGDVLLGAHLAAKLGRTAGQEIEIAGQRRRIAGILSTGGPEDDQIVAPLALAQQILGKPGAVRRIYVSAVTKPEDAFARRDPKSMSPEMYDRWYCSPYAQSIAFQLQEAIPHSHAEQIRQVAQNEGTVLSRIQGLMLLITLAALLASALAVSASMATAVIERRSEVGLMKALGAGNLAVAVLFFAEATLLALLAGAVGFAGGALLAREIGHSIFASQITVQPVLLPVILTIAVLVTFVGSAAAIRRAVKFDPVYALRGDA